MTINNLFVSVLTSTAPYTTLKQLGTDLPVPVYKRLRKLCSISLARIKLSSTKSDDLVYSELLRHESSLHDLNTYMTNLEYKIEELNKWNSIQHSITRNRSNVKLYSPFFICSKHRNCACGHLDLQGKLYYDQNYPKYVDTATKQEISRYITTNKLMSLQMAISKPYLLTTRRNCKHFFTKVSLDKVLSGEAKAPYLSNLESKSYYELQYRKYQKRYKELLDMAHIIPESSKLKIDLARQGRLKEKWLRLAKPL